MSMTDTERYGTGLPGAGLADAGFPAERVSLVDLLDRVLAGGVVVTGEITLTIADVDLVVISLRALLTSVSALMNPELEEPEAEGER
jgi:Gas vesicle protein